MSDNNKKTPSQKPQQAPEGKPKSQPERREYNNDGKIKQGTGPRYKK